MVSNEHFEAWLIEMDDALSLLKNSLPIDIGCKLDFSAESLSVLEDWVLSKYASISETRPRTEVTTIDGLARYVGETFRHCLGGQWEIRLDDPKYVYYGIPQLKGLGGRQFIVCPAVLVTAAIDRRRGDFWNMVLTNYKRLIAQKMP